MLLTSLAVDFVSARIVDKGGVHNDRTRTEKYVHGEEDEYGGYYLASSEAVGGYEGTGIYYTEFEEKDDD